MCYNDIILQDKETSHWRSIIMPLEKLYIQKKRKKSTKGICLFDIYCTWKSMSMCPHERHMQFLRCLIDKAFKIFYDIH